jgi:hypothetical protein
MATPAAQAHAIGLSCKLVGKLVRVEAYFSDDTPAFDALIVVRDEQQAVVAQGARTIVACGRSTAAGGRYEVSVDAGAGHRAKQVLVIPEATAEPGNAESAAAGDLPRDEFTRIHWLRLALGLGIISLLAAVWLGRARIGRYKASRS